MTQLSDNGTYVAYEAEYYDDGKWPQIPRKTAEYGASNASEINRDINTRIDLLSYDQAQAIVWMGRSLGYPKSFLSRIVPYKVEYSITYEAVEDDALNITGAGNRTLFTKGNK